MDNDEEQRTAHNFQRLAVAFPRQWLYLFGDEGAIYSESQNRFAGLDAAGVAAYLAFDAGAGVDDLKKLSYADKNHPASGDALEAIFALTRGNFPAEVQLENWHALDSKAWRNSRAANSKMESIEVGGIPVLIEYPAGQQEHLFRDYFRYCPTTTREPRCHLSARAAEDGWAVSVNSHQLLSLKQEEQLGLGLMHAARVMLYAEAQYDIAFHAAAIGNGDGAVLLCAPRECGKSTLAAYLAAHGFDLLTDEPAFLNLNTGSVAALRLPISLKQGSWPVLQEDYPHLARGPAHVRSDGVKICLADPPAERQADGARSLTRIIFPRYRPLSLGHIECLTPFQTLSRLDEAGLLLARDLSRSGFERFLELVCRIPAYEIEYNSMESAREMLRFKAYPE
jgi:hypothetical protein